MLDAYLQEKSGLYGRFSHFHCEESCPRYGCRGDLVVSASLLDLYAQSRYLSMPVPDLFDAAYKVSCATDNGLSKTRVRFVLRKPCTFLADGKNCSVYPARPAACALFPEYLAVRNGEERESYSGLGHFPCLKPGAYAVTAERGEALRDLWQLHQREILATEIYLFGLAGFTVDVRSALVEGSDRVESRVPYERIEEALVRLLKQKGIYESIARKLSSLAGETGIENYLSALSIAEALTERGA